MVYDRPSSTSASTSNTNADASSGHLRDMLDIDSLVRVANNNNNGSGNSHNNINNFNKEIEMRGGGEDPTEGEDSISLVDEVSGLSLMRQMPSSSQSVLSITNNLMMEIDYSKHPSGIIPVLQNIVATINLDCKLDLKTIALHARNAEYNPRRFAAVIMRIREPKTTALIFASGKMVVTGAKSEELSRLAARKYARIIQKLGFNAKFSDFKIQNIVGSCDVKFPIRLEGLAFSHGLFSSYEPELFPGLIYRMASPKVVLLIFVSGKIVLTGAKVRDEIYQAFENIYPVLTEFRKP